MFVVVVVDGKMVGSKNEEEPQARAQGLSLLQSLAVDLLH